MFSAQFRDHGDIMQTGINSETEEELRLDLGDMMNDTNPNDDENYRNYGLNDLLASLDLVLVKHDKPFPTIFVEI